MSEFVECQNCGRQFFAENLDCPYCGGAEEDPEEIVEELLRAVTPRGAKTAQAEAHARATRSRIFSVLFNGFAVVTAALGIAALLSIPGAESGTSRVLLGLEAGFAAATLAGVVQQRWWGRNVAIAFILWNAAQGVWSVFQATSGRTWGWGPIPGGILLFLWPFFTAHARERFTR